MIKFEVPKINYKTQFKNKIKKNININFFTSVTNKF